MMLLNRDPADSRGGKFTPPKSAHERRSDQYFTTQAHAGRSFAVTAPQEPEQPEQPDTLEYARLDGTTHINIYIRSLHPLGQKLAHFERTPFTHPFYGKFNSMEGFWYYIKGRHKNDALRNLAGFEAKVEGQRMPRARRTDSFYDVIVEANFHKIVQNPEIHQAMVASSLPFDHYYLFGAGPIFVRPPNFEWLVDGFERIRRHLKEAAAAGTEPGWPTPVYDMHIY